jgi:hypothetical protein
VRSSPTPAAGEVPDVLLAASAAVRRTPFKSIAGVVAEGRASMACMDLRHNPETAEPFNEMARYSELHVREVLLRAEGIELPAIAPWGFKWACEESPEVRAT